MQEQYPFLKEIADLTGGEDKEMDTMNFLSSLEYYDNYLIFREFLTGLVDVLGESGGSLCIHEGYKCKRIAAGHELGEHDEDSFGLRNLIFGVEDFDFAELVAATRATVEGMDNAEWVKAVLYDEENELILLKLKDEPDGSELVFEAA
jgi:hypothetical protein